MYGRFQGILQLEGIKDAYGFVKERRGIGLMQGLELDAAVPVGEVSAKALEQGLVLITAGKNVLRFVPPLIIGKEHVDEMAGKLKGVLGQY